MMMCTQKTEKNLQTIRINESLMRLLDAKTCMCKNLLYFYIPATVRKLKLKTWTSFTIA